MFGSFPFERYVSENECIKDGIYCPRTLCPWCKHRKSLSLHKDGRVFMGGFFVVVCPKIRIMHDSDFQVIGYPDSTKCKGFEEDIEKTEDKWL